VVQQATKLGKENWKVKPTKGKRPRPPKSIQRKSRGKTRARNNQMENPKKKTAFREPKLPKENGKRVRTGFLLLMFKVSIVSPRPLCRGKTRKSRNAYHLKFLKGAGRVGNFFPPPWVKRGQFFGRAMKKLRHWKVRRNGKYRKHQRRQNREKSYMGHKAFRTKAGGRTKVLKGGMAEKFCAMKHSQSMRGERGQTFKRWRGRAEGSHGGKGRVKIQKHNEWRAGGSQLIWIKWKTGGRATAWVAKKSRGA